MTDRLKGFVVTFDSEIREDDAEALRLAILCMKRVISVAPVITGYEDNMNRETVRRELLNKLLDVLR